MNIEEKAQEAADKKYPNTPNINPFKWAWIQGHKAALESTRIEGEWIKVEDRLPESGQEVILSYYYNTDNYLSTSAAQYWDYSDGKYFRVLLNNERTDEYMHVYKPMYWMEMPESPTK